MTHGSTYDTSYHVYRLLDLCQGLPWKAPADQPSTEIRHYSSLRHFIVVYFLIIRLSASLHIGRFHYQRCELLVFSCLRYFQSYGLSTDNRHLQQLLHWIYRCVGNTFQQEKALKDSCQ